MKQAKTLKADELKTVLAYIGTRRHAARNRAIFLTSFLSGTRAHEIASLKLADAVDDDGKIRSEIVLSAEQTKGSHARRLFINAKLRKEFAAYVKADCVNTKPTDPLFQTQKHTAFSANTMCQLFLNVYKSCGIKGASSHSGRRTFITNLASKSVSVRVLAMLAGHSSIATTQRYIEVNDDQLRKAVELA
jgi:integrase/recombinase XerD